MNNWCVYKHTFPNNKIYIGITSQSPEARWGKTGNNYTINQPAIYYAIKKYGWENIQHEILFTNLSQNDAAKKEKELIRFYHSWIKDPQCNGYNMTLGGETTTNILPPTEIERIIQLYKEGNSCSNIGKITHHDKNTIIRILRNNNFIIETYHKAINQFDLQGNYIATYQSAREAQEKTSIDYRLISGCLIGKTRQTNNFQWRYYDEKDLKGISPINYKSKKSKKIIQLDMNNNIIQTFDSITDASKITNVVRANIQKCLRGERQTAGGFKWCYPASELTKN